MWKVHVLRGWRWNESGQMPLVRKRWPDQYFWRPSPPGEDHDGSVFLQQKRGWRRVLKNCSTDETETAFLYRPGVSGSDHPGICAVLFLRLPYFRTCDLKRSSAGKRSETQRRKASLFRSSKWLFTGKILFDRHSLSEKYEQRDGMAVCSGERKRSGQTGKSGWGISDPQERIRLERGIPYRSEGCADPGYRPFGKRDRKWISGKDKGLC